MLKSFYIKTYGCAMNTADSNSIRSLLTQYPLQEVDDWKQSDIIVLVTCSIRQQSEDKVAGWGIKADESIFKDKIVVMTGCMAQRYDRQDNHKVEEYSRNLKKRFPWITYIVDIKDLNILPSMIGLDPNRDLITDTEYHSSLQGLFSISHGCNNFCSYCIVPYARGEQINFNKDNILKDINHFIKNDGKLITLLGQNVNSWRNNDFNFVDLLRDIENIEGDFWINFLSSHPRDISDELIELITLNKKFLKHCHIAVQSGSNRILTLMNRQYDRTHFINICKKIKSHNPDFRITTDVIVGFPTETERDFNDTLELIKECDIDMVYIGKYSPREGSVSYKMNDDVDIEIKKEREVQLKEVVNDIRDIKHKAMIGREIPVLIINKEKGLSYFNHEVVLKDQDNIGNILNIKVNGYDRKGLLSYAI